MMPPINVTIKGMIRREPTDPESMYRLKYTHNHPFTSQIGMVFVKQDQATSTQIFPRLVWLGSYTPSLNVQRLQGAYDDEGKSSVIYGFFLLYVSSLSLSFSIHCLSFSIQSLSFSIQCSSYSVPSFNIQPPSFIIQPLLFSIQFPSFNLNDVMYSLNLNDNFFC